MAQLYLLIRLYTHLESFVKVLCVVLEVNSPKSKLMRNIGSLFYARIRDFGTNAFRGGWMERRTRRSGEKKTWNEIFFKYYIKGGWKICAFCLTIWER